MSEVANCGRTTPRVLVVEDDPALRGLMATMLGSSLCGADVDVSAVASGSAALAWLRARGEADAILCDLNLGDMSALDLLGQLPSTGQPWSDRFVVCTGGTRSAVQAQELAQSAVPVLRKPFGREELRDAVSAVLHARSFGARSIR